MAHYINVTYIRDHNIGVANTVGPHLYYSPTAKKQTNLVLGILILKSIAIVQFNIFFIEICAKNNKFR